MSNKAEMPEVEGETDAPVPEEGAITEESQTRKKAESSNEFLTVNQKRLRTTARWGLITLASIMMSISVFFFQTPYGITMGGIAGLGFLLEMATSLSQGIWMLIINGALIIIGLIVLGKQCTLGTIYSSALYTGIINLLELLHNKAGMPTQLTDDPLLALMYAIILYGVGGAIIFNCGATSGGTDIIAMIFKKLTHLNVGIALLIVDFTIICVSIVTLENPNTVVYSFMGLIVKNFLLDNVIEGLGRTKHITVITTMPDEIGKYIVEVVHHGYTVYDARGGFTGDKKNILITICKRNEAWKIKTRIKQIDPSSFVIISNANEIVGKGFGGTMQ